MDSGNTERSLGGELRLHAMVFAIAVRKDDDGTASSDEMGSCITVHGKKKGRVRTFRESPQKET